MGLEGGGHRLGVSLSTAPTPGRTGRLEPNPSPAPSSLGSPCSKITFPALFLGLFPPEERWRESFQTLSRPPHPHLTIPC